MEDPFVTFGIAPRFDVSLAALEKSHRDLSRALHPDKFVDAGASERRASLEHAASVNEAWRVLRDPVRRAEALFARAGVSIGDGHEPKPSPEFLMQILETREALSDARTARDVANVREIAAVTEAKKCELEAALTQVFASDSPANVSDALPLLGELRFYVRLLDEVSAIEEEND